MRYAATGESIPPDKRLSTTPLTPTGSPRPRGFSDIHQSPAWNQIDMHGVVGMMKRRESDALP